MEFGFAYTLTDILDDSPQSSMTRARPSNNGDEGHRSKRMKTGDQKATLLLKSDHNNRVTPPARDNEKSLLELVGGKDLDQSYLSPYTPKVGSHPTALSSQSPDEHTGSAKKSSPTPLTKPSSQRVDAAVQASDRSTSIEIDFSTAPQDPVELAFWVARRISQFNVEDLNPDDNGDEEDVSERSSLSHTLGRSTRRTNDHALSIKSVTQRNNKRGKDRVESNPICNSVRNILWAIASFHTY